MAVAEIEHRLRAVPQPPGATLAAFLVWEEIPSGSLEIEAIWVVDDPDRIDDPTFADLCDRVIEAADPVAAVAWCAVLTPAEAAERLDGPPGDAWHRLRWPLPAAS